MNARGAPLIAVVAALGLSVDLLSNQGSFPSTEATRDAAVAKINHLRTSRPTAVNLFQAMDQLEAVANEASKKAQSPEEVVEALTMAAEQIMDNDITDNRAIGSHGCELICAQNPLKKKLNVMTICNTGSLATGGYGTALGIIRALHEKGVLEQVYACETRPYNQGGRLTAYEILEDGLPGTLICDSAASFLMKTKAIDCVVVGADRVVANGDTANKIGTYQLAVTARHHGVPFYVAAPTSTLDPQKSTGDEITIEERAAREVTHVQGCQIAPEGIPVWNPAFDVTPAELITNIVTEKGAIHPTTSHDGLPVFDVPGFLGDSNGALSVAPSNGWYQLTPETIPQYLLGIGKCKEVLGATQVEEISLDNVSDGNLNYVYIVRGPSGALVVKQALPWVRCMGESWPLPLDRAYYENSALSVEYGLCPEHVPEVYFFNREMALIIMQYIAPPHQILRDSFIQGINLPDLSNHIGTFLARTLFFTSSLHLSGPDMRKKVAEWSNNHALCALTEQVIFTDPYTDHPDNNWTTPQLDADVQRTRSDTEMKVAISKLKGKFLHSTEALIHGDLHAGSFMVRPGSTFAIDPEFAFYGPMAFDIGAIIGNFFLAYLAQPGHNNGDAYSEWIIQEASNIWTSFSLQFLELWNEENNNHIGSSFHQKLFATPEAREAAQIAFLQQLFWDSLGFAGAKMTRRIIGVVTVKELKSIEDADLRAICERRALVVGRELVVNGKNYSSIEQIIDFIKSTAK